MMRPSHRILKLKLHLERLAFYTTGQNTEYGLEKKWAYYNQDTIDTEAAKPLYKLTPTQMMFHGKFNDGSHLLKSSHYLHKELPRRIARRIKDFQSLPYVVAINPTMQEVYELYLRAFQKLSNVPPIENLKHEQEYSQLLNCLLNDHKNVVTSLAKAFHQTKNFVSYGVLGELTERTLSSRLGIRLLAEHHIGLHKEKKNYIGVLCTNVSPRSIIEKCVFYCKQMCEHRYGYSPAVFVSGHTNTCFTHIPAPIEYIIQELIKNAMRATVVHHLSTPTEMPSIEVTICNNKTHFLIRISDRGGGIPDSLMENIFKYSFTTSSHEEGQHANEVFENLTRTANTQGIGGALSGYGFGLPSAAAYAKFLGGQLTLFPMYGLGTDVILKLVHVDQANCFRI